MAIEVGVSFGRELAAEAQRTHPWLHHPLFQAMTAGQLRREQVQFVIQQQGAFFLDTVRHAAVRLAAAGGSRPSLADIHLQRALIPSLVEEAGEDIVGRRETGHALLFVKLAEGIGVDADTLFATEYLPHIAIEKNELFQLQREGPLEALCGGAVATESINAVVSRRLHDAFRTHYGVAEPALDFYRVHAGVEDEHGAKAVALVERLATTDEARQRGRLALRRAIVARTLAADGMAAAIGLGR